MIAHDATLQVPVHYMCESLYLGVGVWGMRVCFVHATLQHRAPVLTFYQQYAGFSEVLWIWAHLDFHLLLSVRGYPLA